MANEGQETYNNFGCAGCHGAMGISSMEDYPNLAGQKATYTVKQLQEFAAGSRTDATMVAMSQMIAGQEQAIADWLASLR